MTIILTFCFRAVPPGSQRIFDDAATKLGLYRVRNKPMLNVSNVRDDCIEPLTNRYGLGWESGVSRSSVGGAFAFVPALCAGAEARIQDSNAIK